MCVNFKAVSSLFSLFRVANLFFVLSDSIHCYVPEGGVSEPLQISRTA